MSHLMSVSKKLGQLYPELKCYFPKIKAGVTALGKAALELQKPALFLLPFSIGLKVSTSNKPLFYCNILITSSSYSCTAYFDIFYLHEKLLSYV